MKKFIAVVLLVLAPSFTFASALRCAEGGLVGGGLGSLVGGGGGQIAAELFGFLAGCDIATSNEPQTTTTRTVTVVGDGGYRGGRRDYYDHHDYDDYRYRERYYGRPYYSRPSYESAYFNEGASGYTVITTTEKPAVRQVVGPTVNNYLHYDWLVMPTSCNMRTGNPGVDGQCLLGNVDDLMRIQKACAGQTKEVKCPESLKYNPGEWAGIYSRLGKELVAEQERIQGFK